MNDRTETIMYYKQTVGNLINWIFGMAVLAVGVINTFWGNDPGFGVFLILLSLVYLLPLNVIVKNITNFRIPKLAILKILLGVFILWASLGVGELFDKIDLMLSSL